MSISLETAMEWVNAGMTVLPLRTDGTKAPAVKWTEYKTRKPTPQELEHWFRPGNTDGLGTVTGAISGELEMFEFEARAATLVKEFAQAMTDNELGGLWNRITKYGYREYSPSGGLHLLYRVTDGPAKPSIPLARRPATEQELQEKPSEKIKVLIETRGQPGFTVLAPSHGRSHDSGRAWEAFPGCTPDTIPGITTTERDQLHAIAASLFDQMPAEESQQPRTPTQAGDGDDGEKPGDHYNRTTTWEQLLEPDGWKKIHPMGSGWAWRRPGKKAGDGPSATTGTRPETGDNLYNFSTSVDLPTNTPITKFAYYAHTQHGGNYAAAASQLRKDGHGDPDWKPKPKDKPESNRFIDRTADTPATEGSLATVSDIGEKRAKKAVRVGGLAATDTGNATHLVDAHGDKIRYCPERKEWAMFTGKRWEWQGLDGGQIQRLMIEVVNNYDTTADTAFAWTKKSLNSDKLAAALRVARTDPRVIAPANTFDAKPYELNTPNGIIDLHTGDLKEHDPASLHTRMTTLEYHPDADPAQVDKFFQETFAGPHMQATIDYLQRLVGHSLIGEVREHVLPYLIGTGRNGKSVFVHSTRRALGDYADALTNGYFMKGSKIRDDEKAGLQGVRFGIGSEVREDDVFDEAETKTAVGGDAVKGRPLYGKYFTFQPTHHFWLMGNFRPRVESGGPSFWSRLKLIEFPNQVPEHLQDKGLENRLAADPALLAWMIQGTTAYLTAGLQEPAHIQAATREYAHDEDTLGQFIEECCLTGNPAAVMGARVKTDDLLAAYKSWGSRQGYRIDLSKTTLTRRLKTDFGLDCIVSNSNRYYAPVMLRDDEEASTLAAQERWMDR